MTAESHVPIRPSFRRLVDSSNAATAILNPSGNLWYMNPAFAALLGARPDHLVGQPFEELIVPEDRPEYRRLLGETIEQEASGGGVGLRRGDGDPLFVHLALRRLSPPSPEVIVAVAVDLTPYARMTRRLRLEKAELEAQVRSRTAELTAANQALAAERQLLQTILQQAAEGITVRDVEGRLIFINAAAQRMARRPTEGTGLHEAPAIWGETFDAAGNPVPVEDWPVSRALRGETVQGVEWHRVAPDGTRYVVLNGAAPLRDAEGNIIGAVSTTTDITERKLAEEERRSIAMFPEQNPHPVLRVGRDGTLLYANTASAPLVAQWGCQVGEPLSPVARAHLVEPLLRAETPEVEVRSGGEVFSLFCVPFDAEGYINVYGRNVTQRKRVEDHLRQALADKETLLREVHHRTKNNLQMLCDLFYLKAEAVSSPEIKAALEDGYMRVYAFARLQEQLYLSMGHGVAHLSDYLRGIAEVFRQLHREAAVEVDMPDEEIHMDLDRTTHCGLLVNELLTNALKHGFPAGTLAQAGLRLRMAGDQVELVVWDSGRGMPREIDVAQATTLGLRIVNILARRMRGTITVDTSQGTTFTIRFPLHTEE